MNRDVVTAKTATSRLKSANSAFDNFKRCIQSCGLLCLLGMCLLSTLTQAEEINPVKEQHTLQEVGSRMGDVLFRALSFLGLPYRRGGNTPETGFDCSGLVRWVFGETLGVSLPRRSEEMSRIGAPVTFEQLKPGDLVFFNTLRRTFSHVGIYLGNNRFIHSPSTGKQVSIEEISTPYWTRRFNGARRVVQTNLNQEEVIRATTALSGQEIQD